MFSILLTETRYPRSYVTTGYHLKQTVRVATRYAPTCCTLDAAAQLQPIPYACGTQRALLPIAVGAININDLMNINDVRESATIFPRPCKLTF